MLATCQNPLHHAKQSATNLLKTFSKREIQRTTEIIGGLNGNKIAKKINNSLNKFTPK